MRKATGPRRLSGRTTSAPRSSRPAPKGALYDLNGNLLYEFGGMSSITIAVPYAKDGLLYVSSGYVMDKKKPLLAIKPGALGDISLADDQTSNEFIVWCQKDARAVTIPRRSSTRDCCMC